MPFSQNVPNDDGSATKEQPVNLNVVFIHSKMSHQPQYSLADLGGA